MKKKLTDEDIVNAWLKYHNTTISEVKELHPDWLNNPSHSRDFFNTYKVTQEQHDEWREWLIGSLMKYSRRSRKSVEKYMWDIYLNLAPAVDENRKTN